MRETNRSLLTCKRCVSLEFRYGTCVALVASALKTSPKLHVAQAARCQLLCAELTEQPSSSSQGTPE